MSGTTTTPERKTKEQTKVKKQPPYNVILHDDDDHSFAYVIFMLKELFAHPEEKGFQMAKEVNDTGRVIVCTTSMERAELKRDQIHAFGPDPTIPRCAGSMTATIEPAE
ncbi:ATP-dependent Clp protease adaptor ClpS [Zavarzinella formosa]|uniref:ATP-dependent Clp protease adaptor ClpS n=1 Tax=Zavarzinella formosa TaxID=360055 RepID=UPI0003141FD3|nr:ATP-dependent Clp protease adaptor ClpS [Zavarzinella formosa]